MGTGPVTEFDIHLMLLVARASRHYLLLPRREGDSDASWTYVEVVRDKLARWHFRTGKDGHGLTGEDDLGRTVVDPFAHWPYTRKRQMHGELTARLHRNLVGAAAGQALLTVTDGSRVGEVRDATDLLELLTDFTLDHGLDAIHVQETGREGRDWLLGPEDAPVELRATPVAAVSLGGYAFSD